MRKSLKVATTALAVSIFATFGVGQAVAATTEAPVSGPSVSQRIAPGPLPGETFDAAPQVYEVLGNIPADMQGDEARAREWVKGEFENRGWICKECYDGAVPKADVGKCLGGIATAIAANVLLVGKVLRVFKLIHDIGGPKKVVELISEGFKRSKDRNMDAFSAVAEVFEEAGAGLGALAVELLAIDGVLDNCF